MKKKKKQNTKQKIWNLFLLPDLYNPFKLVEIDSSKDDDLVVCLYM